MKRGISFWNFISFCPSRNQDRGKKKRQGAQMVEKYLSQIAWPLPFYSPIPSSKCQPNTIRATDTNTLQDIPLEYLQGKKRDLHLSSPKRIQTQHCKGAGHWEQASPCPRGLWVPVFLCPEAGTSQRHSAWVLPFSNGDTCQALWALKLLEDILGASATLPGVSSASKKIQELHGLGSKRDDPASAFFLIGLEKHWLKVSLTYQLKVTCFCTFFLSRQQLYLWR